MSKGQEQAFPRPSKIYEDYRDGGQFIECEGGMTLRDYFAAKAMQGIVVNGGHSSFALVAQDAYELADAMLVESEKVKP